MNAQAAVASLAGAHVLFIAVLVVRNLVTRLIGTV